MISFPAILLNKYSASAVSNEDKFTTCGEEWVLNGHMNGTKAIICNGHIFIIREASAVRNKNFLPSWMVSSSRRIVEVKYNLEFERKVELEEAKKLILENSSSLSKEGVDEINSSKTFGELSASVGLD